jgi:hypothetical protein
MSEKTAVVAPIPSARVTIAVMAKAGALRRVRTAYWKSCHMESIHLIGMSRIAKGISTRPAVDRSSLCRH